MNYRSLALTLALLAASAAGQALAPKAQKTWTPPHTVDGVPDLQGVWTNNTVTPLERPKNLAGKEFYTEADLKENQKKEQTRLELNQEEGLPTQPGTAADVQRGDRAVSRDARQPREAPRIQLAFY